MLTITNDILKAAKFAATNKDYREALKSVMITPTTIVATDSYRLIEIQRIGQDAKEFPNANGIDCYEETKSYLLPADQLLKKLKFPTGKEVKTLPILGEALMQESVADTVVITTTDLESVSTIRIKKMVNQKFPEYKRILKTEPPKAELTVNLDLFIESLQAFKTDTNQATVSIKLWERLDGLQIDGNDTDNKHIKVILMPCKSYKPIN